jgi:hypothetical protein
MMITANEVISAVSALSAAIAAWHAARGSKKSTEIKANVNGNLQRLVDILAEAAITVPHSVAAKVVAAPPADIPDDATLDERLALEWLQKVRDDHA